MNKRKLLKHIVQTYKLSRKLNNKVFCLGESLEKTAAISSEFDSSSKNLSKKSPWHHTIVEDDRS